MDASYCNGVYNAENIPPPALNAMMSNEFKLNISASDVNDASRDDQNDDDDAADVTMHDATLRADATLAELELARVRKDLSKEEEFCSINYTEPIHIFLKVKPHVSAQEQRNHVTEPPLSLVFRF